MKYLGIDYGKKKIGLAISEGLVASPFKTIETSSLKDALSKIEAVIKKEEVETIVIGVAESGESRKLTLNFIQEFKKQNPTKNLIETEETLSTYQAKADQVLSGIPKAKRALDDSFAAAIILENYLESL